MRFRFAEITVIASIRAQISKRASGLRDWHFSRRLCGCKAVIFKQRMTVWKLCYRDGSDLMPILCGGGARRRIDRQVVGWWRTMKGL